MALQVFPVMSTPKGVPSFSNDWGYPRSGGRTHQGTDIFADKGSPVLAVDAGTVSFGRDPLGGNIANLRAVDGTRYYYAHLDAFEGSDRQVRAGEIIGYVGKTGNAAATPPHLHFEVHPNGGAAINPYPLLIEAPVVQRQKPTLVETVVPATGNALKYTLILAAGFAAGYVGWRWLSPKLLTPTGARR